MHHMKGRAEARGPATRCENRLLQVWSKIQNGALLKWQKLIMMSWTMNRSICDNIEIVCLVAKAVPNGNHMQTQCKKRPLLADPESVCEHWFQNTISHLCANLGSRDPHLMKIALDQTDSSTVFMQVDPS